MIRSIVTAALLAVSSLAAAQSPTTAVPTATATPTGVILAIAPHATVSVGQAFDVTIQVIAGPETLNGAGGYIDFDVAKIQVLSATSPGTALPAPFSYAYDNSAGTANCAAVTFSAFPTGTFTLCTLHLQAIATGSTTLAFHASNPRKTDAFRSSDGRSVFGYSIDGLVTVASGPPLSPTITPGGPTPTPTLSPTASTPGPTPACAGDCNDDHTVDSAENLLCVAIAEGLTDYGSCPACDADGNGIVNQIDLATVHANLLNGCPQAPSGTPRVALNATDEEAVANNKLWCQGAPDRACLHLRLLVADPTPIPGDIWCVDNAGSGTHRCCYYAAGQKMCWIAVPTS